MENHHAGAGTYSDSEAESDRRHTIRIGSPAADVFDFLADGTRAPFWLSGVSAAQLEKYGGGVGATYRLRLHVDGPGGSHFRYRVIHHRRPVLLAIEAVTLGIPPTTTFRLAPIDQSATRVALTVVDRSGRDRYASDAVLARRWTTLWAACLPQLKNCLEAELASN
ncbi:MAG: SRPBCC family protein [Candidatus Dormiibacterota bacterium]